MHRCPSIRRPSAVTARSAGSRTRALITEPWPGWHCVWIDEELDGWIVRCLPHGEIARRSTHLAAFEAALEHDVQNGTYGKQGLQGLWVDDTEAESTRPEVCYLQAKEER